MILSIGDATSPLQLCKDFAGDGTGDDGLCIDIVGWHAVQGEAGKKAVTNHGIM